MRRPRAAGSRRRRRSGHPRRRYPLNCDYPLEPLREMSGAQVALEFTGNGKELTLRPEPEGDFFPHVMPM